MTPIPKNEWSEAQVFLLDLLKLLSPLAGEKESFVSSLAQHTILSRVPRKVGSLFQAQNFKEEVHPSLLGFQQRIARWVAPLSPLPSESQKPVDTSHFNPNHGPPLAGIARRFPAPSATTQEGSFSEQIAKPAQKAIHEVRQAIQALASSAAPEPPRIEQFQRALARLQPYIEQLVRAVESGGTADHHLPKEAPPSFRRATPTTSRLERFQKRIAPYMPKTAEKGEGESPIELLHAEPIQQSSPPSPFSDEVLPRDPTRPLSPEIKKQEPSPSPLFAAVKKELPISSPQSLIQEKALSTSLPVEEKKSAALPAQASPPLVLPYTERASSTRSKQRKKRKRLYPWEKDPEQERYS